jgi:uncharacterized membrane protein YphA (DoxX/SURF4 family)
MGALQDGTMTRRQLAALAAIGLGLGALGALGVASGDFAFQWQPVPPDVPARGALAIAVGLLEIVAAVLLASARLRTAGAWLAAAILIGWTALHVPAVVQRPASIADWLGVAESAAMASAALMFAAEQAGSGAAGAIRRGGMLVFGLGAILFGVSHFAYADFTASMIPAWLPQRVALAWFTGAAHALAGLAIASGVLRTLAAALEALMMASFVVLVHLPRVLAHPDSRMEWTMLFVAVTLSGSAAMVAAISSRHSRRR